MFKATCFFLVQYLQYLPLYTRSNIPNIVRRNDHSSRDKEPVRSGQICVRASDRRHRGRPLHRNHGHAMSNSTLLSKKWRCVCMQWASWAVAAVFHWIRLGSTSCKVSFAMCLLDAGWYRNRVGMKLKLYALRQVGWVSAGKGDGVMMMPWRVVWPSPQPVPIFGCTPSNYSCVIHTYWGPI